MARLLGIQCVHCWVFYPGPVPAYGIHGLANRGDSNVMACIWWVFSVCLGGVLTMCLTGLPGLP